MIIKTLPPIANTGRRAGWKDLLTLSTPGIRTLGLVRARVLPGRIAWPAGDKAARLIVQVYDGAGVSATRLPVDGARPVGSAQLTIQRESFVAGIDIEVVLLERPSQGLLAVAWLDFEWGGVEEDAFILRPNVLTTLGVVLTPDLHDPQIVLGSYAA